MKPTSTPLNASSTKKIPSQVLWYVETSKDYYLKLVKAQQTSLLTDLLSNWSNGVIGFGHFPCFPLWHTLFQPMDPLKPKTKISLGNVR